MLAAFRRLSTSKVGTTIMVIILVLILIGFAMGDIQSIIRGGGFGASSDTMAKIGSRRVTDRDISRAMERRLSQVREENPEASYATIAGDFDKILDALIDAETLEAFADKYGFILSKRLIDGQIATIPAAKGLNGQFSEESYRRFLAQQRITDEEVRMIIRNTLLQQLVLAPVAVNARAPVGLATPYASVLLEGREGEVAFVPAAAFKAGLKPGDVDLQRFYEANRARYMVPEQRALRLAKIGPERVAAVQPSDKEIADYYNANQAKYAAKETRVITQAVVPDQAAAQAIVNRIKGGQTFVAAAAPAGLSAADISVGPQTRQQFTSLAGQQIAAAAFGASQGAVLGPLRSELGWHVVKVDQVRREGGKTLTEARGEIVASLLVDKRKAAIEALVDQVQNALDDGASFSEVVAQARLSPIETPPITGNGTSRTDPNYKFPEDLKPALKTGFDMAENDEPVVETLPNDGGYVVIAPARIIGAAPAPLASIRDRVAQDWIDDQATKRARQLADSIAAKAARASVADAAKGASIPVEVRPVQARRIQLSQFQGQVPPPLAMLFSLTQGKARTVTGGPIPGFYVVKVSKIIPGNALTAPGLIGTTQRQMQDALSQEYAAQFMSALRQSAGARRNDKAIAATKTRITSAGGG